MMMITCLILWIPGGTTYVPVAPPTTRAGPVAFGRGATAATGRGDEVHAVSAAVNTATRTSTTRRIRRLLTSTRTLPAMPRASSMKALMHADVPATKYLKERGGTGQGPRMGAARVKLLPNAGIRVTGGRRYRGIT